MCIVLAIPGTGIESKRFSTGKRCMRIRVSGRQIDYLGTLYFGSVTGWGGWCSVHRWCRLFESVGHRGTLVMAVMIRFLAMA